MSEPHVRDLSEAECWTDLRHAQLGRLAVSVRNEPDVFPINFVAHEGALYFRTAPGSKLLELTVNERVAFEIDSWTYGEARSVVVKGVAERLELQSEIDEADRLPLLPWIPTPKYRWVRIVPTFVRGVAFERAAEPARY
ncbi:pyridoxamine 5'-phosphate oxidase family protein [Pseudolysinimonas sp.]|uniref:pyridoxamine 5'-phosphate oxidase family protein n=1 Tax=Pseudolysinimonas sp. TaxID=2680009 RepID=UPI003F7F409D